MCDRLGPTYRTLEKLGKVAIKLIWEMQCMQVNLNIKIAPKA